MSAHKYVMAIDQGTTSTRAILFDHEGTIVSTGQLEHEQIFPRAGWVEHDPVEIWKNTREVIGEALARAEATRHDVAAVGITNQRETTVAWSRKTGKPLSRAIVWDDNRVKNLVTQYENNARNNGIEYDGKLHKGEDGLKALRKMYVFFFDSYESIRVSCD